jgi:hypothetical protein
MSADDWIRNRTPDAATTSTTDAGIRDKARGVSHPAPAQTEAPGTDDPAPVRPPGAPRPTGHTPPTEVRAMTSGLGPTSSTSANDIDHMIRRAILG